MKIRRTSNLFPVALMLGAGVATPAGPVAEAIRLSPDKYPEAYYLRRLIRGSALADYEKAAELAPTFEDATNAAQQAGLALGESKDADAKAASARAPARPSRRVNCTR